MNINDMELSQRAVTLRVETDDGFAKIMAPQLRTFQMLQKITLIKYEKTNKEEAPLIQYRK